MIGFGSYLRGERERAGMSQAALAQRLGVSAAYLGDVELGRRAALSEERLLAAAEALGIHPNALRTLAACDRGHFRLTVVGAGKTKLVLAALLHNRWSSMTEETAERLIETLEQTP